MLYVSPSSKTDETRHLPAVHFALNRTPSGGKGSNAEIFRHFILTIKNLTVNLDEELLYKICQFANLVSPDSLIEEIEDNNSGWEYQLSAMAAASQLARYYFGTLKLTLNQIKLSVHKSSKLSFELKELKRKLGFTLVTFEDANVELDPFSRAHSFETLPFLWSTILKHYQDECLSQAMLILGSTDFLGNPIGFINDVSEGVMGVVSDGNLGGLLKNVTHGAANSTAKVAGSLSYGISKATLEEKYDEKRLMIRKKGSDNTRQQLMAGLKGLGFGVLGGLTSIITEPIQGAASDGAQGLLMGLGYGVLGTVTKPAIGLLDLATGAASAVRDSSKSSARAAPPRVRPPRVCQGLSGTLPTYQAREAQGQQWLYRVNGMNTQELYMGFETLGSNSMIIISSEKVVVYGIVEGQVRATLIKGYTDIELARASAVNDKDFGGEVLKVELVLKSGGGGLVQRQLLHCESHLVAESVSNTINNAKQRWEQERMTVLALPGRNYSD